MLLALDISITSTGYVVLDSKGVVKGFGCVRTTNSQDIYTRLTYIEGVIKQLITDFNITTTAIEAPAFGGRGNMSYQLFGVHFSVVRLIVDSKLKYKLLNIASIKKFATGSGRASKQQMLEALPKDISDLFISNGYLKSKGLYDLTDAYFIGMKYLKEN